MLATHHDEPGSSGLHAAVLKSIDICQ